MSELLFSSRKSRKSNRYILGVRQILYSRSEIELLKLGGWCKDLPLCSTEYLPEKDVQTLIQQGLLRQNEGGNCFRTTKSGYDLLEHIGYHYHRDSKSRSNGKTLERRLQSAEIILFIYRLGADVFLEHPFWEGNLPAYLPAFSLRRQDKSNLLSSTRLTGFLYTENMVYVPYYITFNNTGIYPLSEQRMITSSYLCNSKPGVAVYTGQKELALLLQAAQSFDKSGGSKAVDYWTSMQKFSCPVCFVPLSEDGLRQLRMMTAPDYKEKLCKYLLGRRYQASDNRWHDGIDGKTGERYQIGIDFNLKDFDKGLPKHLIVLDFQQKSAQEVLSGKEIILHTIDTEAAEQILELPHNLPELTNEPYRTEKGECVVV